MKEIIGSKVCELVGNEFSKKMNAEKTFIVVKVKGYDEVDDWCQHYIIRDKKVNEEVTEENGSDWYGSIHRYVLAQ